MGYRVTGQRNTSIIGDDGLVEKVVEVTYRTDDGVRGHVDIPVDRFNVEAVRAAIESRVAEHDAVSKLGH